MLVLWTALITISLCSIREDNIIAMNKTIDSVDKSWIIKEYFRRVNTNVGYLDGILKLDKFADFIANMKYYDSNQTFPVDP